MGVDQEANNIMLGAMRAALADGWGGSMMGTDISDILIRHAQAGQDYRQASACSRKIT